MWNVRSINRLLLALLTFFFFYSCELFEDDGGVGAIVPAIPEFEDSPEHTNLVFLADDFFRLTQQTANSVKSGHRLEIDEPITIMNPDGEGEAIVDGEINFSMTEDSNSALIVSYQDWENLLMITNSSSLNIEVTGVVDENLDLTITSVGTITVSDNDQAGEYILDLTIRITMTTTGEYTAMAITGSVTVDGQESLVNDYQVSNALLAFLN